MFGFDQNVFAAQLFAVQDDVKAAFLQPIQDGLFGPGAVRRAGSVISAFVPKHHRPGPVIAFGDDALELPVVERMVLNHHGQALVGGVDRWPFWNSPALERPCGFEAKIVMKVRCLMLLNCEPERPRSDSFRPAWFGASRELPFGLVLLEAHRTARFSRR